MGICEAWTRPDRNQTGLRSCLPADRCTGVHNKRAACLRWCVSNTQHGDSLYIRGRVFHVEASCSWHAYGSDPLTIRTDSTPPATDPLCRTGISLTTGLTLDIYVLMLLWTTDCEHWWGLRLVCEFVFMSQFVLCPSHTMRPIPTILVNCAIEPVVGHRAIFFPESY